MNCPSRRVDARPPLDKPARTSPGHDSSGRVEQLQREDRRQHRLEKQKPSAGSGAASRPE